MNKLGNDKKNKLKYTCRKLNATFRFIAIKFQFELQ